MQSSDGTVTRNAFSQHEQHEVEHEMLDPQITLLYEMLQSMQ